MTKALLLGGTGAMGSHVTDILADQGVVVGVTSRNFHENRRNVTYYKGNAMDDNFLEYMLEQRWDVIIDFMVYDTEKLKGRIDKLLAATNQYIFISSARVYANYPDQLIDEKTPRLLDVCIDEEYLKTDEYALAKAREENIIISTGANNWTIVRPSLTYGENRLQLGVYEKENWLYRAIHGRSIVFSYDILDNYYLMTYGRNVAEGIAALVANPKANGQFFNVVQKQSHTWREILNIYVSVLEEELGKKIKIKMVDKCTNLDIPSARYQVLYGRYFSRRFNNTKMQNIIDTTEWLDAEKGLSLCIKEFLKKPVFQQIDWRKEALIDRAAKEWTPLWEIKGMRMKLNYLKWRIRGI